MPDNITIEGIRTLLVPVFEKYQIREAILFGSFAKGNAHAESDVDLFVDSGLRFVGFMEAVRRAVERPVDVLDVTHIEKDSWIDRENQA
ncbi:MAG: nucleotidyltransferase domain-containing protein [Clostridia bacterium]|nr:nucleotidyltransferase domain-containing protein [Clostridia bacterium]